MCQLVGACLNEPSWTDGKCRKEKRSLEEKDGLLTLIASSRQVFELPIILEDDSLASLA
jgi:hypothetical protein